MNVHEYQAKELLAQHGIAVPAGHAALTVEEAVEFFREKQPRIADKIDPLFQVGLGYIKLGQSSNSLSGGEAQRIRLATQIGSGLVGVDPVNPV